MAIFLCRKREWVWLIFFMASTLSLPAQTKHYTLTELIDSARQHLPVLTERQAMVSAAEASVVETKHSFLPRLRVAGQLDIGSDNSVAGGYFTYGIIPSVSGGIRAENDLNPVTGNQTILYGEYELMNFGLKKARINSADAFVDLRKAELGREDYELVLNIARLYFNLQKNQIQLGNDSENIKRYQQVFTVIKALTGSGINPGADSLLAKAELSRAKIGYNQTLGKVNIIKEQLSYLTGIPSFRILINADTGKAAKQDPSVLLLLPPADTLNNPYLNYYRNYNKLLISNDNFIRKSYLPKIILNSAIWSRGSSIQYNDNYKSLATGFNYQRVNYALAIGVVYDLFSGMYRRDKLRVNGFLRQAGEAAFQQEEQVLDASARQADQSLAATRANLSELPVLLQAASSTYNQKLSQYRAGLITLIDLTNAGFVLYRSQTDYTQALADWNLAQLDKAVATGTLYLFIQKINQ